MRSKIFIYSFILITIASCVFCDDKKSDSQIVSYDFADENLSLKYSEKLMVGKSIEMGIENNMATIILNDVVAGHEKAILTPVKINGSLTNFTFSGKSSLQDSDVVFSGGVDSGICTININVKVANKELVNKWYYNKSDEGSTLPVMITWKTKSNKIELFPGSEMEMSELTNMLNSLIFSMILENITYVEFFEDGNIAINLSQLNTPKNVVFYSIPEKGKLNIHTNSHEINNDYPFLDTAISLLIEDIKLDYVIDNDILRITIPEKFFTPIFDNIDLIILMIEKILPEEYKEILKQVSQGVKKAISETTEIYVDINLTSVNK